MSQACRRCKNSALPRDDLQHHEISILELVASREASRRLATELRMALAIDLWFCGSTPVPLVSENLETFNESQLDARTIAVTIAVTIAATIAAIAKPDCRIPKRVRPGTGPKKYFAE